MLFKCISYLELSGGPFVWRSRTICAIFVECHEEQFCEFILNLDLWFRRICRSKILIFVSSGSQRRTVCEILVEGIMRNNSVKLF